MSIEGNIDVDKVRGFGKRADIPGEESTAIGRLPGNPFGHLIFGVNQAEDDEIFQSTGDLHQDVRGGLNVVQPAHKVKMPGLFHGLLQQHHDNSGWSDAPCGNISHSR
jgi:hypothetical protein